jgi:hypothetical protein
VSIVNVKGKHATTVSASIGTAAQRRKKMASRALSRSPSKPPRRSPGSQRRFTWGMALTAVYNIVGVSPSTVIWEQCVLCRHLPRLPIKALSSLLRSNSWANPPYRVLPSILCNQSRRSRDSPRGMMLESGLSKVRP